MIMMSERSSASAARRVYVAGTGPHRCREGASMEPGSQKGMKAMNASSRPAA